MRDFNHDEILGAIRIYLEYRFTVFYYRASALVQLVRRSSRLWPVFDRDAFKKPPHERLRHKKSVETYFSLPPMPRARGSLLGESRELDNLRISMIRRYVQENFDIT